MGRYGFSDVQWQYNSSVAFAYIEENHGGITEPFTVPYPIWRMTSTLYATRTPEDARFRMILVDEQSGRILEGAEIHFPGSVTKTVVTARGLSTWSSRPRTWTASSSPSRFPLFSCNERAVGHDPVGLVTEKNTVD